MGAGEAGINNGYLPSDAPHKFLDADEWGEDKDVRRVILQSGSLCGLGSDDDDAEDGNKGSEGKDESSEGEGTKNRCVGAGKAIVDTTFTPTETEKRYIFSVQSPDDGVIRSVHVAVTMNDAHEVFIQALGAGKRTNPSCTAGGSKEEMYQCDVNAVDDLVDTWNRDGSVPTPGGYGVGFVKYVLAPEMVRSLRG